MHLTYRLVKKLVIFVENSRCPCAMGRRLRGFQLSRIVMRKDDSPMQITKIIYFSCFHENMQLSNRSVSEPSPCLSLPATSHWTGEVSHSPDPRCRVQFSPIFSAPTHQGQSLRRRVLGARVCVRVCVQGRGLQRGSNLTRGPFSPT